MKLHAFLSSSVQAGSQGEVEDWIKVIHLGKAMFHRINFMVMLVIAVLVDP